jgi:hypothetical protein
MQQPLRLHPMRIRSQNKVRTIRKLTDGTVRYPLPQALISEAALREPTYFTNAVKVSEWHTAMQTEFNTLLKNRTWTLVLSSVAKNVVGCKWIFKLKRKADGSIKRHKTRLVAKGFHQHVGIDYGETLSPVVKLTTIRTVLSHAYSSGWSTKQIDIQNAFLHGLLSEDVYMEQHSVFIDPLYPHHICKLKKALYGRHHKHGLLALVANWLILVLLAQKQIHLCLSIIPQQSPCIYLFTLMILLLFPLFPLPLMNSYSY